MMMMMMMMIVVQSVALMQVSYLNLSAARNHFAKN